MSDYADAIELARTEVAAAAPEFLPDLCDIYGPGTEAHDDYGDLTTSEDPVHTDVPCSYKALFGYERSSLGVSPSIAVHYLKIPAIYDVAANQKIVVQARGNQLAVTFQVIAPLKSSTELLRRLAVTEQG